MGLGNQGCGVGVGDISLGVLSRTLCSSGCLLLLLKLLLLQTALLLAKLGPTVLEPDLVDGWIDRSETLSM